MFMYRRGPHRIWLCISAGCDDIADVGTMSAVACSAAVVAAAGVKDVWRMVVGRLAKMLLLGMDVLGRRVGREEKDLIQTVSRPSSLPLADYAELNRVTTDLERLGCLATSRTAVRRDCANRRDMVAGFWVAAGAPTSASCGRDSG